MVTSVLRLTTRELVVETAERCSSRVGTRFRDRFGDRESTDGVIRWRS
jgi:hypothetical protein